jgi:lactate dehydrogenase-like 2-hydroxyacid dehydrogenase
MKKLLCSSARGASFHTKHASKSKHCSSSITRFKLILGTSIDQSIEQKLLHNIFYRGEWEDGFDKVLGQDIRGSTVGFIGLGEIGQAVVKRLAGFEVGNFVYTGHREKPEGK